MVDSPDAAPRRTAAEAFAQAEAKARIRTAVAVRRAGLFMPLIGVAALLRFRTWLPWYQVLGVHIHGGPSFRLSLNAIVGIVAIVLSPVVFMTGAWLRRRAIQMARRDPVTAAVVDELMP
jgi:hypothetical protein